MINRNARLAQQCAPLLLTLSLLSASFCPAQSHSPLYLELNNGKLYKRILPKNSEYKERAPEVSTIAPGALPNSSFSAESKETSTGEDYLNEVASDGLYCWPVAKLPVKVFFQPAEGVPSYRHSLPLTLKSCFDEWTAAS